MLAFFTKSDSTSFRRFTAIRRSVTVRRIAAARQFFAVRKTKKIRVKTVGRKRVAPPDSRDTISVNFRVTSLLPQEHQGGLLLEGGLLPIFDLSQRNWRKALLLVVPWGITRQTEGIYETNTTRSLPPKEVRCRKKVAAIRRPPMKLTRKLSPEKESKLSKLTVLEITPYGVQKD